MRCNIIEYKIGDIFTTRCSVIAHGVNCRGTFVVGIAKRIEELFPQVKEEYLEKFEIDRWRLGEIQVVEVCNRSDWSITQIVNMAIKYNYVDVDYDALAMCLNKVFDYCELHGLCVALAGEGWGVVKNILEQCANGRKIRIEVWSLD